MAEEGKKRGQAVCYFEAAVERLKEAWKNAEKISSDKTAVYKDVHTFTTDVLMGKSVTALLFFRTPPSLSSTQSQIGQKGQWLCLFRESAYLSQSACGPRSVCTTTEKIPREREQHSARLPLFTGVIVAKPQPFDCHDPDVCGADIFNKLVPMVISSSNSSSCDTLFLLSLSLTL